MNPAAAAKPKLLVVDDDAPNLSTFRRVFRQQFDVSVAGSGEEALQVLARVPIDVALVDYSMPGMNGLELLHRMEALHPTVKRIMLTAHGDLPELTAAVAAGVAITIVMKPWDRDDIVRVVEHAMQLSTMSRVVGEMRAKVGTPR